MDTDLMLVVGIVLAGALVPSLLSAWTDGRTPRVTAIVAMIAGGLIVFAAKNRVGGYSAAEIPDVFARVIQRLM